MQNLNIITRMDMDATLTSTTQMVASHLKNRQLRSTRLAHSLSKNKNQSTRWQPSTQSLSSTRIMEVAAIPISPKMTAVSDLSTEQATESRPTSTR